METFELKAELSMKMLELEKAIELGYPYPAIKATYDQVKSLQFQLVYAEAQEHSQRKKGNTDLILD